MSDLLIALAYYSIPIMLFAFIYGRKDLPFRGIFVLFSLFILSCGTGHLLAGLSIWKPLYGLRGVVKLVTAIVSLVTAVKLYPIIPKALKLPSSEDLEATNKALQEQISEREEVEASLRQSADRLQKALDFEALLKRITDKVRDTLDESQILQAAVHELGQELGVRSCNAALYDLTSKTAVVHYEYTDSTVPVQGRVMSMENSPDLYRQILARQYFQFCSLFPNPHRGRVSMLVCPILDDREVLGDVWLINDADYAFKDIETRLLQQVANHCAIALRQARLYQETKAQVQELQRLNHLKDDFLSTVSHELRTPVANIKLATRMLALLLEQPSTNGNGTALQKQALNSDASTQKQSQLQTNHSSDAQSSDGQSSGRSEKEIKAAHYLKILQDECQREIGLINDLLDLQRLETNHTTLTIEPINLDDWLLSVVKPFEGRAASRQQHLTLKSVDAPLPIINTDSVSLGRILTELINNACKYTPPGEAIVVSVQPVNESMQFRISNSGIEIPAREILHIFDKFYRVPSADPWKQGGTGLGLALVKKLTECLGGEIDVLSQDMMTNFTVTIPLEFPSPSSPSQSVEDASSQVPTSVI
ncbi:MAG: GAF domain-containing sensor histidine kinase [Leptolyngbyaceae bacterium]|nr:GAF domain-containing sensor histidine kinase [Leptolyngbyaceae bacterium]